MKQVILLLAIGIIFNTAHSQIINEAEVPTVVQETFTEKYPTCKVDKWEKNGIDYRANFDLNRNEMVLIIDPIGNILETEAEINVTDLPSTITSYCEKNYKGKGIKKSFKKTTSDKIVSYEIRTSEKLVEANGAITYEAATKDNEIIFDAHGNFLREEKNK